MRERRLLGGAQRAIDRDERHPGRRLDETEGGDVVPERRPGGAPAVHARRYPGELELERSRAGGTHREHRANARAGYVHDAHRHRVPFRDGNLPAALQPELHHLG